MRNETRGFSRRAFMADAALAATGIALGAAPAAAGESPKNPKAAAQGDKGQRLAVRLDTQGDSGMRKVFAVLKDRIEHRCAAEVVETNEAPQVILSVSEDLPPDAFRISQQGGAVEVAGGSWRGVLYGAGKFLRTSSYDTQFIPSRWRGTSMPHGTLRGMYFANHFHNWYAMATGDEVSRYTEDMALWGVSAIMTSYPLINLSGWDDPEAEPALAQTRKLFQAAKDVGLETVMGVNNLVFNTIPPEIRAKPVPDPEHRHGNHGTCVCPSNPAGRDYILKVITTLLEKHADIGIDYLCVWPYDEGGCGCEQCMQWGSNGFVRMSRDIAEAGRKVMPDLKMILSTWTFDTPPAGEWQGLADALARDGGWADYILADSHGDFPRYPLEKGVPGNLPLINFPEISMWGNTPWGGYGAHPLPKRFERLWGQAKHVLRGGLAYSEGIYEDINKAIVGQFYWDPNAKAQDTLREYIAYEFSPAVVEDVLTIIETLEDSATRHWTKQSVDVHAVRRAAALADVVDALLPAWARNGWRWEILHLRAILDRERYAEGSVTSPVAQKAMRRLVEIYHCLMETDDPYHHRVRPPLK